MIASLLFNHTLLKAELFFLIGGFLWVVGAVIFDRWYFREERDF